MLKTRRGQVLGSAPNMTGAAPLEFIRRREVERRTGLPRSTIYWLIQQKRFPSPVPIGAKAVAWIASEVAEWQASRVAARNNRGEAA